EGQNFNDNFLALLFLWKSGLPSLSVVLGYYSRTDTDADTRHETGTGTNTSTPIII
ncbi:hypothetical protein A2U01_0053882, partial [Trifolium medium]|nr:hypothetical protein [Trifolium medium]